MGDGHDRRRAEMRSLGRLARRSGWDGAADGRTRPLRTPGGGPRGRSGEGGARPQPRRRSRSATSPTRSAATASGRCRGSPRATRKRSSSYREAIAKLAPGVAVAGPDVSGSGAFREWGYAEALSQTPAMLTGHHYPLGCASKPRPQHRNAAEPGDAREGGAIARNLPVDRPRRAASRCASTRRTRSPAAGCAGVSNTFASALWATGYIGTGDGGRNGRRELPRPSGELQRLLAAVRA